MATFRRFAFLKSKIANYSSLFSHRSNTHFFMRHGLQKVSSSNRSWFHWNYFWKSLVGMSTPQRKIFCISTSLAALMFPKSKDDACEEEIVLYCKKAKLAFLKSEFDGANDMYHKGLAVLTDYEEKDLWDKDKLLMSRTYIYDQMGDVAFCKEDFDTAESLYKETIKGLLQQGYRQDHNSIMELSLKLAMIFVMRNELDKAEVGYRYIIETQKKKVEAEQYKDTNSVSLLGMFASSYSRYLMLRKKFSEARPQLEIALDAAKKSLGEDHVQIPVLYSDMGKVASMQDRHDEALDNMKRAVEIAQKIDSPDIAVFLCNLGEVYLRRGDVKQAKRYCVEAEKLAQKSGDKETVRMAKLCFDDAKSKQ